MRPVLRPGLQVLRRDLHTVQLGLDWPGLMLLPDSPALQAVLAAADGVRTASQVLAHAVDVRLDVSQPDATRALDRLIACGALVDQAATSRNGVDEQAWAFLWLLTAPHDDPHALVRQRRRTLVATLGRGRVAEALRTSLASTDLPMSGPDDADLVVIASDSEPDRALADIAIRRSVPHLWVWIRELVGVVGPFVEPGRTPCLRCVDHLVTDQDPGWPALVDAAAVRPLVAPACDPVLAALVAAFATHESVVWATGLAPQTLGRMLEIPYGCGDLALASYPVHPRCGCSWPDLHDTMGA